jgi:hypothetical protein
MADRMTSRAAPGGEAAGAQRETGRIMHKLWDGIAAKLDYAEFHLEKTFEALIPPRLSAHMAAIEASGDIIGHEWQRPFFAHFDAFLSATRSVPEIIRACFGEDRGHLDMRRWFDQLPDDEQTRRSQFSAEFSSALDGFRNMPLSKARNISDHRRGVAPVVGEIVGMFGIYAVTATERAPTTEIREVEPEYGWLVKPRPIQPAWTDFYIGAEPLFDVSKAYLDSARSLRQMGLEIEKRVHSGKSLTDPPDTPSNP